MFLEYLNNSKMTGPFDQDLLSHFPDSVKFICHNGAGYDQIDVGKVGFADDRDMSVPQC